MACGHWDFAADETELPPVGHDCMCSHNAGLQVGWAVDTCSGFACRGRQQVCAGRRSRLQRCHELLQQHEPLGASAGEDGENALQQSGGGRGDPELPDHGVRTGCALDAGPRDPAGDVVERAPAQRPVLQRRSCRLRKPGPLEARCAAPAGRARAGASVGRGRVQHGDQHLRQVWGVGAGICAVAAVAVRHHPPRRPLLQRSR
mmetsp:Transcript_39892/g.119389  ORF Transcript_39892/g.119389 Transcript_39892/m.119389 type:complete len:203 (+) Transcript_39892:565-1173(+)